MAIEGMGSCLIPNSTGIPCGGQINQGEPIKTIALVGGGVVVGHKVCVDGYEKRKQEQELVKRADQDGPGGPVDMSRATDAIQGSIPLERRPGRVPDAMTVPPPALADVRLPEGVIPLSALPMTEPKDAWADSGPPGGALLRDPEGEIIVADPPRPVSMPLAVEPGVQLTPEEEQVIRQFRQGKLAQQDPVRADIDNRFTYHAPTPAQIKLYQDIRATAHQFAHMILNMCPDSRERAMSLTHLDEVVWCANASIARHDK